MNDLEPGMHPRFDIERFDVASQRVLRRMAQLFHLTRDGSVSMGAGQSKYRYALLKPTKAMRGMLHTDREVIAVFSDYADFQPRTIDAFEHVIGSIESEYRLEKVVRILISGDPSVSLKINNLLKDTPDTPIIVPFHHREFRLATPDEEIFSRIRQFTFSRDLFSMSSPLKSDLYFFGRSNLINEIVSKLASGRTLGFLVCAGVERHHLSRASAGRLRRAPGVALP